MSKYHVVSSGMITRQALPSITRQRGTTTGSANLMLYGAGKTTVSNNTTFIDSSANAFTVTRNGDTVQSGFNPFSQASSGSGYFDGTGDYLTVTNASALQLNNTTAFTIECWVYPTNLTGDRFIIENYNQVSPYQGYSLAYNIFTAGFLNFWDGGGTWINTGITLSLNEWTHIAVTYEGSGSTRRFFKNGVQSGSAGTVSSAINYTAGSCSIGAYEAGTTPWVGYISNLRIVKGTAVYTSNFTPPTSPLTAITNTSLLLLMDNYSIVNSTSTNLPVTINTGASISTAQFPTGMSSSMFFNGTTGYITVPNGGIFQFGTGDFTIEWWQYQTGSNPYPRVFSIGTYPTAFGVSIESGFIYYWTNTASAAIRSAPGVANAWVHIAVSRSSSVTRIFLNGVQLGANIPDTANISNSSTALSIAAETTPNVNTYFTGYISNFRSVKGSGFYTANFTPASLPMPTTVTVPNFVTNNIYGLNQIP